MGLHGRPVPGRQPEALALPVPIKIAIAGPEEESAESESGQRGTEGGQQSEVVATVAVTEPRSAEERRAGEGAREAGPAPHQEGISQR